MSESRKIVTIVFTDVTGSTALGEQLDPEAMRRVMDRYFAEMRTVLERHGGTVEKFIGDAVMAVFGIPVVHEDDALRALRAASEMRERLAALNSELSADRGVTIAVRTGVNTGEVVAGDPGEGQAFATGDAVNVAARLEQAAAPGQILIGPQTHRLVREAVRAEAVAPLELKGKGEPVEAWRLVEVLPHAPAFSRRIDAPFVGRERELAALRTAYERVRDERSCELVTVTGAPGIGKSRLIRELLAAIGAEPRVVVGRCLSYGEGITYWPLAEIVRQVAGSDPRKGLLELLGAEADAPLVIERILAAIGATDETARTEEIFWATRLLLERLAHERTLVVVVDDIHWAEPTLLDLIEYLVGFTRAPVFVTCTARLDLFDRRGDWPRSGTVPLEALNDEESAALIEALLSKSELPAEMRRRITERAEGNPLFVEQMLALTAENGAEELAIPVSIQALLAARLDHLPAEERSVLVRGAVEGRLFHQGAISALLDEKDRDGVPGRLLTLARKALIRPDESVFRGDDAFRFVHALVRDAAYEAAPKELRAELHERFADWLEKTVSDQTTELDEIVGYHLERSFGYRRALGEAADDVGRRAGERLATAGERALNRGDADAAAKLLRRALHLLPREDSRTLELATRLAHALHESGALSEAVQTLRVAEEQARNLGVERLATLSRLDLLGFELVLEPEAADLERMLGEAHAAIERFSTDDAVLAAAWDRVRDVEWFRGHLGRSREAAEKAFIHAEKTGDVRRQADAEAHIGATSYFDESHIDVVLPRAEASLEWARSRGVLSHQAMATSALAALRMEQRRFEEARQLREEAWEMLHDLGLTFMYAAHRGAIGGLPGLRVAELDDLVKRLRDSYALLSEAGEKGILSTITANLAVGLYEQGRYEEAEEMSRVSEQAGQAEDLVTQVGWRAARAMAIARRGELDAGEALARDALTRALGSEYAETKAEAYLSLGEVLRLAGRLEEARAAIESARAIFETKGFELSADAARAKLAELSGGALPAS